MNALKNMESGACLLLPTAYLTAVIAIVRGAIIANSQIVSDQNSKINKYKFSNLNKACEL